MPARRNPTRSTLAVWPANVLRQAPSTTDHSLTVRSPLAVATTRSTGEKATLHTPRLCPRSVRDSVSVAESHSFTVLS